MTKREMKQSILLIVESPAKCKKIEQLLGEPYKCMASYGHIRELPHIKNINIENDFEPSYTVIQNSTKKKNIEALKKEIKKSTEVILATDDDREGEAIAWHICQLFGLDVNTTKRIIFHEITEDALKKAVENPRTVDMAMVYSQRARQILDILVGFKVSPILWKLVAKNKENSLSAGRCQSPALKIIYENQKEIDKCVKSYQYEITGYFTKFNLPFRLSKTRSDKQTHDDVFTDKQTMLKFLTSCYSYEYSCSEPQIKKDSPPKPFTTSRLQQVASNVLHYSPKETMSLCQSLYENGYITYMRTDSKIYSKEFVTDVQNYIQNTYNNSSYIHPNIDLLYNGSVINQKQKKITFAQEAHEAIRPTNISLQSLPDEINNKEKKLYKLIWQNTIESCMADAIYSSITADILPKNDLFDIYFYKYSTEIVTFPGWRIVKNDFQKENKEYQYLQNIQKDTMIPCKKIVVKTCIKGNKQHYTEARLVQLLEEKGIGRPSTFSFIVDKIQERGYVKKQDIPGEQMNCMDYEFVNGVITEIPSMKIFGNEKNKLVLQPIGAMVIEILDKYFSSFFNYTYTAQMEEQLDDIKNGNLIWHKLCHICNDDLDQLIKDTKNLTKIQYQIDDAHTYMIGKYGPVVKHTDDNDMVTFKPIKTGVNIAKLEKGEYSVDDIVKTEEKEEGNKRVMGKYKGADIILQKGKYGLHASYNEKKISLKSFGNRPIENISLDEIINVLENNSNIIREITNNTSIRKGPKGNYLFYKTSKMKKPQFYDIKSFTKDTKQNYLDCDEALLQKWIEEKYKITF